MAIAVDICVGLEDDGDDRQALDRHRAKSFHARHAVDGVLDRLRDQHFDLLSRQPRRLRLDANLRRCELGKNIVLRLHERDGAVAEQQECERYDDATEADGKADDGGLNAAVRIGHVLRRRHQSSPPTWICERNSSDKRSCAPVVTMLLARVEQVRRNDESGFLLGRHVGWNLVPAEAVLSEPAVNPGAARPPDHRCGGHDHAVNRSAIGEKCADVHSRQHAAAGAGGVKKANALDARICTRGRRDIPHLGAPRAARDLDGGLVGNLIEVDARRQCNLQQELGALDQPRDQSAVDHHRIADDRSPLLHGGGAQCAHHRLRSLDGSPVRDHRGFGRLHLHEIADALGIESLRTREGRLRGGEPGARRVELRDGGDVVRVERGQRGKVKDGAVSADLVLILGRVQIHHLQPDRVLRFFVEGDDGLAPLGHFHAQRRLDWLFALGFLRGLLAPFDETADDHGGDAAD